MRKEEQDTKKNHSRRNLSRVQKPYDYNGTIYSGLTGEWCPECPDVVINTEYLCALQEDIAQWKDIIMTDISNGDNEMLKMDKRRLQQVKIEYRNAKMMMQKINGLEIASA